MKFSDFFCFDAIIPELQSASRDEVITELVNSLEKAGQLGKGNSKNIIKALIDREKEASTGMGKGVAVPHVKHQAVKKVLGIIGQKKDGLDFCALDKKPVYSVIMLISPTKEPQLHLEAMEKIFSNLQYEKFRNFLRQSQTIEKIKDLLDEADQNPDLE
jgi:nitrogen PTS system EIIA component